MQGLAYDLSIDADCAASLQIEYDKAIRQFGENSPQALEAEREAKEYFIGKPAPVTPAV